jgi:DNA-binding GntR family transcriptional regulator
VGRPPAGNESRFSLGSARVPLLSDQVYDMLRDAIVGRRLQPGDRIVESEVAREIGVSQAPVRDGLKRLVHDGLITHVPRRGHYVSKISEEEAHQARQVRAVLEELAGRCAAKLGDEHLLHVLSDDVEGMRRAASQNDLHAFRDYDINFHRTVCEASGNVYLMRLWNVLEPSLRTLRAVADPMYMNDPHALVDEHAKLLEILRGGDAAESGNAFARHARGQLLIDDDPASS